MMGFSFGTTSSLSGRTSPNWFAMSCGLAYVLCYLFLPFYSIYVLHIPGTEAIVGNPLMILPVILGIAMAISAVLLPVLVSLVLGGVSFVLTLIFALTGHQTLSSLQLLSSGVDFLGSLAGVQGSIPVLRVSVGYGAILCMVLIIAYFLLELFLGQRFEPQKKTGGWVYDNKPKGGYGGPYRPR